MINSFMLLFGHLVLIYVAIRAFKLEARHGAVTAPKSRDRNGNEVELWDFEQ